MRAVVTRVTDAKVLIEKQVVGEIQTGFLVLLGIKTEDTESEMIKLADKICGLRIFTDASGQMKASLEDVGGSLLIVSQFTLYGNCKKGRRPEFLEAARPERAIPLYEAFIARCKENGFPVQTGVFGAKMEVVSTNDGPVTLMLDTEQL